MSLTLCTYYRIQRVGRKRMFYVEVDHHGHSSATYVGGPGQGPATEDDARARAGDMLRAHVARCRAIGPDDGQERDVTTGVSLCPDDHPAGDITWEVSP